MLFERCWWKTETLPLMTLTTRIFTDQKNRGDWVIARDQVI
jgi:hypothetical protein